LNSSTKFTFPLFESVCIEAGYIQNREFHSKRFKESYRKFYWKLPHFELFENIEIPPNFQNGKVKLRISYNETEKKYNFQKYVTRTVQTLKLVVDHKIDYDLKFEERSIINALFQLRGDCDDVLIAKNENITDSSYANIVFWDGDFWYTPTSYLLKGTKRSLLLKYGQIKEMPIKVPDIGKYKGFQLVNAMLDFKPHTWLPIDNIRF